MRFFSLRHLPDSFWVLAVITLIVIGIGLFSLISKRPIGLSQKRIAGLILLLVVSWGAFVYSHITHSEKVEKYARKYELENYKGCTACWIELKEDMSYFIDSANSDEPLKTGEWEVYFSDTITIVKIDDWLFGLGDLKLKD